MQKIVIGLFIILCGSGCLAYAGTSPKEAAAMAMVNRAADLMAAEGAEKAFAKMMENSRDWTDADIYVIGNDLQGVCVLNTHVPEMVGKNLLHLKDVTGHTFVKSMIAIEKEGWVIYKWINPQTKQLATKHLFVRRVGSYIVAAGFYD